MISVLLVLLALFLLSAPFLLTVRNADRASAQMADRATASVAIDAAGRHARAYLGSSHPAIDPHRYFDSEDEIEVRNEFPDGFYDATDPNGVMWDLDVEDEAGRIDLNSASPHVIANLVDGVARLAARTEPDDTELSVSSTAGFLDVGFCYLGRELIGYTEIDAAKLAGLVRGLGTKYDDEEQPLPCGPSEPLAHDLGAFVIDQRAFALARWRLQAGVPGRLARFDAIEQVARVSEHAIAGELGTDFVGALERHATVYGDVRAGPRWGRGVKLMSTPTGLPDWGCVLPLRDTRNFNAGTTVMITDGVNTELALVLVANENGIRLTQELALPFEPYETVVRPLVRRPVNINTAGPGVLMALMENLKLRLKSSRITRSEAEELTKIIIESRPFTGFRDFLERVVLPAAGLEPLPADAPVIPELIAELSQVGELAEDGTRELVGFIDQDDAVALYKNALNANDNELAFSTMPFCFTTRDVYRFDLRASVNAENGVERAWTSREEIDLVVPQRNLLHVWGRQEDFDEEPRLDSEAPWWLTGPEPTTRLDRFGSPWPSRSRAHLGPYDPFTQPEVRPFDTPADEQEEPVFTFASRDENLTWIQPAPSREDEFAAAGGKVMHFDDETTHIEGRYLPSKTVENTTRGVGWIRSSLGLSPLTWKGWIQPRSLTPGDRYLDVAGGFFDSDRLSLFVDEGDLVLRVLDAMGDHPGTAFVEESEIRYPLAGAAGLPEDVWTHFEVGVAGNRPDQMRFLVDGRWSDDLKIKGLTRLTSTITGESRTIPVESTEDFPDVCTIRIGDELLEVFKDGPTSFRAVHETSGENAGFGGRLARELYGVKPEQNQGVSGKDTDHQAGAEVQLYGYSVPFKSNVPNYGARVSVELGSFAVARIVDAKKDGKVVTDVITLSDSNSKSGAWDYALGLTGKTPIGSLVLEPVDGRSIEETMAAFGDGGGYAAILSTPHSVTISSYLGTTTVNSDVDGFPLGGIEIVRHVGIADHELLIGDRDVQLDNVKGDDRIRRSSHVLKWEQQQLIWPSDNRENRASWQTYVIPLSIPLGGGSSVSSFLPPDDGQSEFAQITHTGGEAGLTEWVRYDEPFGHTPGYLVRDDPDALDAANAAAHAGVVIFEDDVDPSTPGGGPGGTRPVPPGGVQRNEGIVTGAARARRSAPEQSQGGQVYWHYAIGEPETETEEFPITRAVSSVLQFRGVMGTYSHAHQARTQVLPVWKTVEWDPTGRYPVGGWPGRFDRVALADSLLDAPVDHATVLHAHRPYEYLATSYVDSPNGLTFGEPGSTDAIPQQDFDTLAIYVGLEQPPELPFAHDNPGNAVSDTRQFSRLMAYPSGELPRGANLSIAVGGPAPTLRRGAGGAGVSVPSAVVDELVFDSDTQQEQLVLLGAQTSGIETPFYAASDTLVVRKVKRSTAGDLVYNVPLDGLREDAGLLRIGNEILCYDHVDRDSDTLHIPPQGRGLLGTEPSTHMQGTSIHVLESWRCSVLAGAMSADSHLIPVVSLDEFSPDGGTLLIEEELVHYTHIEGGALAMPRASSVAGERDQRGRGLFRGRYGTREAAHAAGTPVIVFPFRYWDRWEDLADDPELSYFQLDLDQPGAFWRSVFWDVEDSPVGGSRFKVLQRLDPDVPWDADPARARGLDLLERGLVDQGGNPIGKQSDSPEWRVFLEYDEGAYDARFGTSHGWKATPKLMLFGTEYIAPGRVLRRVDR